MSESHVNNAADKIAALTKEAENLKLKLEEERQKLNDVARKCRIQMFFPNKFSLNLTNNLQFHQLPIDWK